MGAKKESNQENLWDMFRSLRLQVGSTFEPAGKVDWA